MTLREENGNVTTNVRRADCSLDSYEAVVQERFQNESAPNFWGSSQTTSAALALSFRSIILKTVVFFALAFLSLLTPVILRAQGTAPAGELVESWTTWIDRHMDETLSTVESLPTLPPASFPNAVAGQSPLLPSAQNLRSRNLDLSPVRRILREDGLPGRLISVAAVESDFDAAAVSPKGAAGLWQLMPDTARRFGLHVTPDHDERFDPLKSTTAAADYLRVLYGQFHAWPLALAAYNVGEGQLQQVIERAGAADFWAPEVQSRLPVETRNYVRKVLDKMSMTSGGLRDEVPDDRLLTKPHSEAVGSAIRGGNVVFALTSEDEIGGR